MGEPRLEEVQLLAQVGLAGQSQVQVVHEGLRHSRSLFILHPHQTQGCGHSLWLHACLPSAVPTAGCPELRHILWIVGFHLWPKEEPKSCSPPVAFSMTAVQTVFSIAVLVLILLCSLTCL